MARKQVSRNLPPLEQFASRLTDTPSETSKQLAIETELLKVARRLRKQESRPFYPMRQVADYFSVPLRTVALAYLGLEKKGFLNCIRGSQTLLVGKKLAPRSAIRGVVGIPLWLHAFVVSPYSRLFNIELEERLRENGFVADIIFFHGDEVKENDFAQRLLNHNLDQVIWHTPHPLALNILLSLKDHGIRQVIIQPSDSASAIPVPTYLQDWQGAYREMAQVWRANGISRVLVPDPDYLPSKRAVKSFLAILARHGLETEVVGSNARLLRDKLAPLRKKSNVVIAFVDQLGADTICNEEPVILSDILESSRVAFCRGPIRLPYFNNRPAQVDLVRFSPLEIADRLVNDLVRDPNAQGTIHTFEARFEAQVTLNKYAEML